MSKKKNRYIWEKEPQEWPCGAARMWRKICFDETGWEFSMAPDSISTVKAMAAGYETRNFSDLPVYQQRMTYGGSGFWRGYVDMGKARYFLGYSLFYGFFATIRFFFIYPFYIGIAFCLGYFGSFFTNQERTKDIEVLNFFKIRLINKLTNKLKRK